MSIGTAPRQKYISASVIYNHLSPFLVDQPLFFESEAGTTVYGAKHPGTADETKYAAFVQSITGNKAFKLPTDVTAPQQTSGAVTAANQLRTVVLVDGVPVMHSDDSLVAPTGMFVIGVGGGTAVADATLSIKGTTAADLLAGSVLLSVASSGADTQTILVGDIITVAGDSTVYRCTETSQALNGTTEVLVSITPPIQVTQTAGLAVTVATSDDRTVITDVAPRVGALIEVIVLASGDIAAVSGGALTAGRIYEEGCKSFYHSAGNCNVTSAIN